MFARPRPRKSLLPAPSKKRKITHAIEEINFDNSARADYLTGFHKRKVQRTKLAQQEAAKRARQEKIDMRKQLREARKREVEEHVQHVSAILREADRAGGVSEQESAGEDGEEWDGLADAPVEEPVDHEEEYIDEDKYTSVIVESVSVSRDGLHKPEEEPTTEDEEEERERRAAEARLARGNAAEPKKKKKKFRYETKAERQAGNRKQKIKKLQARG
ncbi:nucleolar protein 12-domain-containing protein [Xylariales sp. AK1849]|nr:nucleolar protein 12-domain-containing protein [Xylariales sp. AK1849]